MKRQLFLSLLVAGTAHAGSLELDARFDSDNTQYNDAAKTAGAKDATNLTMQTGRLDYKGKVSDALSFRFRTRFNRASDSTANAGTAGVRGNDSLNATVDFASLTHKVMDNLSVTVGKTSTEVGGFEVATPGSDLYFKSQAYRDLDYGSTVVASLSNSAANPGSRGLNVVYAGGVKAVYSIAGQDIGVMVANGPQTSAEQSKLMSGVVWKGSFLDKQLQTVVSYHATSFDQTNKPDLKANFLTAGLKWDAGAWFTSLDVSNFTYGKLSDPNDDTTMSVVLLGGMKFMDNHAVKLMVESSQAKTGAATQVNYKFMGYGLAYEYKPMADTNFRYHVAYTSRTASNGDISGYQDRIENHVIFGAKLLADFLK